MAVASFKCEFPRRQAMLAIYNVPSFMVYREEVGRVPVFVWPMPTQDGFFIVEHQDGRCQKVQPYELTFLDSKELFDQFDWKTDEA